MGARTDLAGNTFVFFGRLAMVPRRELVARIEACGGTVRRGLTRRTHCLVIGHGAAQRLADGGLDRALEKAARFGVETMSERALLRRIGLEKPAKSERPFSLDEIAARAALDLEVVRLFALLDVIVPLDGACGFQDLVTARNAARLLGDGAAPDAVITGILAARARAGDASPRFTRAADGSVKLQVGEAVADLDGQLRLPFAETPGPSADDLFDAAEEAEEAGDLGTAATLYGRCMDRDPDDPSAPFNLANVLREQGKPGPARLHLNIALARDPGFAEAWYNLADLAEEADDAAMARDCLLRAVKIDEGYADALYNLASLEFRNGAFREALDHWERYLAFDRDSEWGKKAREGILLCRHHLG